MTCLCMEEFLRANFSNKEVTMEELGENFYLTLPLSQRKGAYTGVAIDLIVSTVGKRLGG